MQRIGPGRSDGWSDALQPDLSPLWRQGQAPKYLSDLLRGWPRLAAGFGGSTHSGGCAKRFAPARCRKGNAGTQGAPAGDLYITIRVDPHPFFERDGDNIDIKVPITVTEAGLGAKIEVPTIDGRALLKIPQGTKNGQKFRLREKGVYNAKEELAW